MLTKATRQVQIDVPRDRDGTFEPQIVKKRQCRLTGVDEIVLSLCAKGLTTGHISAHFSEIYGAPCPKRRSAGSPTRCSRRCLSGPIVPLDGVRRDLHRRDRGQGPRRPGHQPAVYAAIGVSLAGEKDVLGLWAGTGGEGAKFWFAVLTDLKNRGVSDTFFLVCDGLKGLPQVVTTCGRGPRSRRGSST